MDHKTAKQIADELGLRERSVLKYLRKKGLQAKRPERQHGPEEAIENAPVIKKRVHLFCAIVILVLVFAAYSNALHNSFIWDDEFLVRDNICIRSFSHAGDIFKTYLAASSGNKNNFYRPIQELSYMVDFFLWGYAPFGFHLTNVILHALCALCAYFLSFRLLKNVMAAFITGALFGIHPINTEAVTYVAGRADSLYLLFFLISFILFLKSIDGPVEGKRIKLSPYIISVSCYALSVLSKEIGIILPLLLLLYVATFYQHSRIRNRLYSLCLPYIGVAILYAMARKIVLDFSSISPSFIMAKFNIFIRLLTTFKAICVYLALLITPFNLHMERKIGVAQSAAEPHAMGALVVMTLIFFVIWRWHGTSRKLFFAGAWFFIGLIPVSNIVPINSFIAEHWVYLPAIGVYMIAASGITKLFFEDGMRYLPGLRKISGWLILAVIFAFYSVQTFERNKDWKDADVFFKNTIKYSPNNARLHLNFGNACSDQGKDDDALQEYLTAVKLQPKYAEAYSNIGSIYLARGEYQKAKEYVDMALKLKPDIVNNLLMRGILYEEEGDVKKAEEAYIKSVEILPDFVNGYKRLGQLYLKNGQIDNAVSCWKKIIQIAPGNAEATALIGEYSK